jgi:hypothetical protein
MIIHNEEEYEKLVLFIDGFFEDPDNYSVEDGKKVKEILEAMKEYEKTRPAEE